MPKKPKKIPSTITEEQLKKILAEILKRKNFVAKRNALMIVLSYYLGLRPKETRCIKIHDINFEEKNIFIPAENNKQRNEDYFPVPDFILKPIFNYIKKIPKKTPWLFPNKNNFQQPLDRSTHRKFFNKAITKTGMNKISYIDAQGKPRHSLTLYSLRHSFGTFAYMKLKDIPKTSSLLRQYDFSFRTTLRYIHTANKIQRKTIMSEIYD